MELENGVMTYKNGDVYHGNWTNHQREGRGKMTYKNGDVYHGNWTNDQREGTGKMTYKNGEVYVGEWKNDQREGTGKMTYQNRDVYVGEWKNDQREGTGEIIYTGEYEDNMYDGEWKNDKREGRGIYYEMYMGDYIPLYDGTWENDIYKPEVNNIYNIKVEDIELWSNKENKITESLLKKTKVMDIFTHTDTSVYKHLQDGQIVFYNYDKELFYIISRENLKKYCDDPKFIIHTCNEDGTIQRDVPYLYLKHINLYQLLPISKLKKIIENKSNKYQFIILTNSNLKFESTISEKKIESGNLICEKSKPTNKDIVYSMYRLNWEDLPKEDAVNRSKSKHYFTLSPNRGKSPKSL
jgi:hypothetical protein